VGKLKIEDGSQQDGYILTSDATGQASWQPAQSLSPFTIDGDTISNGNGTYATNDFVFGSPSLDYSTESSRMFFDKSKAAFRAGTTNTASWDEAAVGNYSFASGERSTASGLGSVATGLITTASGLASFSAGQFSTASATSSIAMGEWARAQGNASVAIGNVTSALGNNSTALGLYTTANGNTSTAMGVFTVANGYAGLVIGLYNEPIVSSESFVNDTTPLFIIGNGAVGSVKYH